MSFQAEEISIYNSSTNQSILTSENSRKVVPFSTLKCFNIGGAVNMVCVHVSSSDLNVITLTHNLLHNKSNFKNNSNIPGLSTCFSKENGNA